MKQVSSEGGEHKKGKDDKKKAEGDTQETPGREER